MSGSPRGLWEIKELDFSHIQPASGKSGEKNFPKVNNFMPERDNKLFSIRTSGYHECPDLITMMRKSSVVDFSLIVLVYLVF